MRALDRSVSIGRVDVTGSLYGVGVPRLSEFYGIAIYMYFGDHNPPHFHAIYGEYEALVRIDDGSLLGGRLPRTAARLVEQWRQLHEAELMTNWKLAHEPAALSAIEPLQ